MSTERAKGEARKGRRKKSSIERRLGITGRYKGVLRHPLRLALMSKGLEHLSFEEARTEIQKRIEADHDKKMAALFESYKAKPGDWQLLALTLAYAHVPAFAFDPEVRERIKKGRTPKLTVSEIREVLQKLRPYLQDGFTLNYSCLKIWKKDFKERCTWRTFRDNIPAVAKIFLRDGPLSLIPSPDDVPAVARFKADTAQSWCNLMRTDPGFRDREISAMREGLGSNFDASVEAELRKILVKN